MPRETTVPTAWAAITVVTPRPASAYECTETASDPNLTQVWLAKCIPYAISRGSDVFAGEARRTLVADSFAVWSAPTCTGMTFKDIGYTDQVAELDTTHPSGTRNSIGSVDTAAEMSEMERSGIWQDRRLIGITLTRYSPDTGELIDTDIVFNAVDFEFEDLQDNTACRGNRKVHDLRNTLVHEIGHVVGFDHVATDAEATMHPSAEPCETKKRDLSQDDIDAVCDVYPADGAIATCKPPPDGYDAPGTTNTLPFRNQCNRGDETTTEPGGCSCGAASPARSGAVWAALLLFVCIARRRR